MIEDIWPGYYKELYAAFSNVRHSERRSYKEVLTATDQLVELIPLPCIEIAQGARLYRARLSALNQTFSHERDVSYNPHLDLIKWFGRANEPGQSVFYAGTDPASALFETIDHAPPAETKGPSVRVTVSMWRLRVPLRIGWVPFAECVLDASLWSHVYRESARQFEEHCKSNYSDRVAALVREVLQYLSAQYAQEASSEVAYYVTCAYFNTITRKNLRDFTTVDGLLYPSVKSRYQGDNVALLPTVVDRCLEFVDVMEMLFDSKSRKITGAKVSDYFGADGSFLFIRPKSDFDS